MNPAAAVRLFYCLFPGKYRDLSQKKAARPTFVFTFYNNLRTNIRTDCALTTVLTQHPCAFDPGLRSSSANFRLRHRYFPGNKKRPFGPFINHRCFLKRGRFQPIARRFRLALPTILLGGFKPTAF